MSNFDKNKDTRPKLAFLFFLTFCPANLSFYFQSAEDCEGVSHLAGKVRGLRQDVQRKISRLRQERGPDGMDRRGDQAFPCSNSSFESLPSGSGSSEWIY